jgi:hypothetical protein
MQLGGLEGAAGARLAAIRDAFAGMNSGRLPPHMLFSDRDFDANDYEALLALDDAVQSKGAALQGLCSRASFPCSPARVAFTLFALLHAKDNLCYAVHRTIMLACSRES